MGMVGRQVDDPTLARRDLGAWRMGQRPRRVALARRTLAVIFPLFLPVTLRSGGKDFLGAPLTGGDWVAGLPAKRFPQPGNHRAGGAPFDFVITCSNKGRKLQLSRAFFRREIFF